MTQPHLATFTAQLQRPAKPGAGEAWTFLLVPKVISKLLPRRGRVAVQGSIHEYPFQATLEPDGQRSHWLKVSDELRRAAGVQAGALVNVQLCAAEPAPEPQLPQDLRNALAASPEARATWEGTTTLARVDWIHWVESAKQAATRKRRIANACEMLANGDPRVCCFDNSGFYSKSLSAPQAAE